MAKFLTGDSEVVAQMCKALNLPKHVVGFTLRVRANQLVTLEVETEVEEWQAEDLPNIFQMFNLTPVEDEPEVKES